MKSSNQWQVVGKPAKKGPQASTGQSATAASSTSTNELIIDPAFAVLDKQWQANKAAADAARARYSSDQSSTDDEHTDQAPTPPDEPTQQKPRKKRAPKPKKPKVQEVVATLDSTLAAELAELSKYASNDLARGEALAAYLLRSFDACELPFNKLLASDFPRAAQEPWSHVAAHAQFVEPIADVLRGMDLQSAGSLVVMVLDALVEGQPTDMALPNDLVFGSSSGQGGGRAGIHPHTGSSSGGGVGRAGVHPPRAKVGALLMMALLAHAQPWALMMASEHIRAAGAKYSGSGRVLILLWAFAQFHRVSIPACTAAYARAILPQLLPLSATPPHPSPSAQVVLLRYADHTLLAPPALNTLLLAAPHGTSHAQQHPAHPPQRTAHKKQQPAQKQHILPLVPPETLDTLVRGALQGPATSTALAPVQALLQQQLGAWRQVVVGGAGVVDLASLVRATLDTAAAAAAGGGGSGSSGGSSGGRDATRASGTLKDTRPAVVNGGRAPPKTHQGQLDASTQQDLVIQHCAATLVACCVAQPSCFDAWVARHKQALRGSAAVLGCLGTTHREMGAPLRATRARSTRTRAWLQELRGRHAQLLTSGKGWQGEAAAAADRACVSLLGGGGGGGGGGGFSSGGVFVLLCFLLLLPALMVVVRHDGRVRMALQQACGSEDPLTKFDLVFDGALAMVGPHVQHAWAVVGPHVQHAWAAVGPHVQHAWAVVGPHVQHAWAAVGPHVKRAMVMVGPSVARVQEMVGLVMVRVRQQVEELVGKYMR